MSNYRPGRAGTGRSHRFPLPQCFSAPPPPPSPAWIVLDDTVNVRVAPPRLEQEWALVGCAKRTAYGCGEHGQKVIDGLTLYVRLVKPSTVTSALYIHASDDARRSMREQFREILPPSPIPTDDGVLRVKGFITAADANHMVLMMFFDLMSFGNLAYYILYDAVDHSLAMIPVPPELQLSPPSASIRPLTLPRDRSDGAGGYEMAVMSHEIVPPGEEGGDHSYDDVLYTWTPSATVLPPVCMWQIRGRPVFPQVVKDEAFFVECMFSFQGKLFFGDLALGLVCFNLPITPTSNSNTAISLDFIPLPPGVYTTLRWETNNLEDTDWMDRNRTIGCTAQGSIKLVCIDRSAGTPADVKLSVWTLDVSIKRWNKDHEFRAVQLWKWFGFRKRGLPETPPKCPVLMPDGSITFLLPRLCMTEKDPVQDYICNVDLNRMKFGWSGEHDTFSYRTPVVVPGNFFTMVTPPVNVTVRTGIFI